MRTAALASLAIVLVGVYLAVAASLAFGPTAIAIGILVILATMAVTIVVAAREPAASRAGA